MAGSLGPLSVGWVLQPDGWIAGPAQGFCGPGELRRTGSMLPGALLVPKMLLAPAGALLVPKMLLAPPGVRCATFAARPALGMACLLGDSAAPVRRASARCCPVWPEDTATPYVA